MLTIYRHLGAYDGIRLVLGGLIVVAVGLSALARRRPNVAWLKPFRPAGRELPPEAHARIRRRTDRHVGVELMLFGFAIPLVYVGGQVLMFDELTTRGLLLSFLGTAAFLALGGWIVWNARER